MVKGLCSLCGTQIGTSLLDQPGYMCSACKKIYCGTCIVQAKTRAPLTKNVQYCPDCGHEVEHIRFVRRGHR